MKLELEDIKRRIDQQEDKQSAPKLRMKQWEKMYQLDADFTKDWRTAVMTDGREQVTTPDPYNVINLAMRLIPSQPKIDIPPREETDDASRGAQKVEQWLTAMYQRVNQQQGYNFVEDLKLSVFKRGVAYVEAKWIGDELPEKLKKKAFPILIRTLDPLEVGYHRGPHYVEYAYHRYEDEVINVRQAYPHLKKWEKPPPTIHNRVENESNLVTVTEFWYMSKAGDVWHCIIVDEEFAKEPAKTDYPIIPIIQVCGEGDNYSILHAINGLWQYKCRLASNIGTGVLWSTWPFFAIQNEMGQVLDDIDVRPMATVNVPAGTKIDQVRPDINLNVLNAMMQQVETNMQQATFPGVLYGDSGGMQAGYGVNILSQAASGRVNAVRESLELGLTWLNELVLGLVEAFDEDNNGVELFGRDERDNKLYKCCLYKDDIQGYYENAVQLKLNLPSDDMALQTLGIRMVDSGLLSRQTFHDKYLKITVPSDEQDRILAEQTEKHPDIMKKMSVLQYMKRFPDAWWIYLKGTEFEATARQLATDAALELGIPLPPGFEPESPEAPGMPPMPPMGPDMGPPPPMMPPAPPMQPTQPPQIAPMPMGGGLPPEMQGQLGGAEAMGLDPAMNPALFAGMTGQEMAPTDELMALAGGGLPPGVM